jgi:hypothetical protein
MYQMIHTTQKPKKILRKSPMEKVYIVLGHLGIEHDNTIAHVIVLSQAPQGIVQTRGEAMSSQGIYEIPEEFKIAGLYRFFPKMVYREGEPDPPPLGPFVVRGSYEVKRPERDVPVARFLILKPEEGCILPTYNEYAVEYPENLIAAHLITFERKGSALRIRVQLLQPEKGFHFCQLNLRRGNLPVRKYVLYEEQVEGTWIPIEVDGQALKP